MANVIHKIDNYIDGNFNTVLRFSSLLYIVIEAMAFTAVNLDPVKYSDLVTYTEFAKSVYLTWVEFVFGVLFVKTTQKARMDGILDITEIFKIVLSFIMVTVATLMIAYLMMIAAGWIDLKTTLIEYGFSIKEETVIRTAHVTTLMVILLSLVMTLVTALVFNDDQKPVKNTEYKLGKVKDDKPKEEKKEDKKEDLKKEDTKSNLPAPIESFLKPQWLQVRDKGNLIAMINSLTSGKYPEYAQIKYNGPNLNLLSPDEISHIFEIISNTPVTDQVKTAVILLELHDIFPASNMIAPENSKYVDDIRKKLSA